MADPGRNRRALGSLRGRRSRTPAVGLALAPARGALGVLHATSERGPIDDHAVVRLELVASHAGSRLRMLHVLTVFQEQAETDALTGLLNRRSFEQRAGAMLRSSRGLSIAIADLDHFKRLNDAHGHAAGDQALRVFSRLVKAFAAARSGVAARLGGEEFVIVVPRGGDAPGEVYEELRSTVREGSIAAGGPAFTVSFGVALHPADGGPLGDLLGAADRALYQAKSEGRDRVVVYGSGDAPAAPAVVVPVRSAA